MNERSLFLFTGILALGYLAAREKRFWNMRRSIEPVSSPLARAISQLVGVAGGIYLALGLLSSFLNLELPVQIKAYGFGLDPLALLAMAAAIIQPYLLRVRLFVKKYWR